MNEFPKKPNILLVGDSDENVNVAGELLRGEGYEVTIASTGKQVLSREGLEKPDLIILDADLTGMDAYEECKRLKSSSETTGIPIVFMVERDIEEEIANCFKAGGDDYLSKPLMKSELFGRVRTLLGLKFSWDKIESLSLHDKLLNIPNKRFFNINFENEWRRAAREKKPVSLLMIDIDEFKKFNTFFGHIEGDRCLMNVAMALQACFTRPGDFVARFGGDQFVCVLPKTDLAGAWNIAEGIREAVEKQELVITEEKETISVTVSIGCNTIVPGQSNDMVQFVTSTYKLLFDAKSSGRNRVFVNGE